MKHSTSEQGTGSVPAEKVMTLVREMLAGVSTRPNPEDPSPPGPWDPYIRRAIGRLGWYFGPHPDPWREIGSLFLEPGSIAALKPQPLPPRLTFMLSLSQEVVDRATLIYEVNGGMSELGQKQGIIVVGGIISRFADDWCGTGWRPKWPFPGPPPWWWVETLTGLDLIVMGTQFVDSAKIAADKLLQDLLQKAGARLNGAGMARM